MTQSEPAHQGAPSCQTPPFCLGRTTAHPGLHPAYGHCTLSPGSAPTSPAQWRLRLQTQAMWLVGFRHSYILGTLVTLRLTFPFLPSPPPSCGAPAPTCSPLRTGRDSSSTHCSELFLRKPHLSLDLIPLLFLPSMSGTTTCQGPRTHVSLNPTQSPPLEGLGTQLLCPYPQAECPAQAVTPSGLAESSRKRQHSGWAHEEAQN